MLTTYMVDFCQCQTWSCSQTTDTHHAVNLHSTTEITGNKGTNGTVICRSKLGPGPYSWRSGHEQFRRPSRGLALARSNS